ncbi:MAG: hypothetical protein HDT20_01135 [Oscillibacter sp.]|nr:hypothetical protein [Oscillibacter sp.]
MNTIQDQITELNQSYNNLGEDLVLMESVMIAMEHENEFPTEYIASSLRRTMDYTEQHLKDVQHIAESLLRAASRRREFPNQYGRD